MSYDVKCYALAKVWLGNIGETYEPTITQLAQRLQDTLEDFEADLSNERERDYVDGSHG